MVTIVEEASEIEAEEDHMEIEEDSKADQEVITGIDLLAETSEIDLGAASTAVRKDTWSRIALNLASLESSTTTERVDLKEEEVMRTETEVMREEEAITIEKEEKDHTEIEEDMIVITNVTTVMAQRERTAAAAAVAEAPREEEVPATVAEADDTFSIWSKIYLNIKQESFTKGW